MASTSGPVHKDSSAAEEAVEHATRLHKASAASQKHVAQGREPGVRLSTISKAKRWALLSRKTNLTAWIP